MLLILMSALAIGISWALTSAVGSAAVARGIVDLPNARSMHAAPTPRGGGFGLVIVILAALAALGGTRMPMSGVLVAVALASAQVATAGGIDDVRGLSPR